MNKDISVIILTYNEKKHITRCIESLKPIAKHIFIIDSFSNDGTVEICEALGAKVFQNKWINYANQFNWGLENCPIDTEWVMRMDADEYIEPELIQEISNTLLTLEDTTKGIYLKRKVFFKGKWIRSFQHVLLRIWHHGNTRLEQRWMDEHIHVPMEQTVKLKGYIVDDNLNNIGWWTNKHNNYATREAIDLLNLKYDLFTIEGDLEATVAGDVNQKNRWFKKNIYAKLPYGVRPFFYYFYRYFFRLGFLEGFRGFLFHTLQSFWYRLLVDAKVYEIETLAKERNQSIKQVIDEEYGFKL